MRGVYRSFHSVSAAQLQLYLQEFDFRDSTRKISDSEGAELLLRGGKDKQLVNRQPENAQHA